MAKRSPLVMVVDDEWLNRELIDGILTAIGYRSLLVGVSEEAVPKANENKPDLIMIDIRMPRMDGYEVCRLLRQQTITAKTPILLISGLQASHDDHKRAAEAGANYIIDRSVGVDQLIKHIQELLPDD